MKAAHVSDKYSDKETEQRATAALRRALLTPYKPQSEMKLGKSKLKTKKSPKGKR